MFGISFGELMLIGVIALMIVGPQRLPKMLGTLGRWIGKLRRITTEVRYQTGIDDLLREEGLRGGLNELKGLVRPGPMGTLGALANATAPKRPGTATPSKPPVVKNPLQAVPNGAPYEGVPHDLTREYPEEGCDSYGCLPDDLYREPSDEQILEPAPLPRTTPEPPTATPEP